jgi:hypothetical protein
MYTPSEMRGISQYQPLHTYSSSSSSTHISRLGGACTKGTFAATKQAGCWLHVSKLPSTSSSVCCG